MILIIALTGDPSVAPVLRKFEALGVPYAEFDPTLLPSSAEISVAFDRRGKVRRTFNYAGRDIDLDEVRAVWNRPRTRPVADPLVHADQAWWVAENYVRFLSDLYECIDCYWMPERPSADRDPFRQRQRNDEFSDVQPVRVPWASSSNKLHQLAIAGELGFRVPRTLITNSPDEFLAFFEACEGKVVAKRAANVDAYQDGEKLRLYTYPVQRRDLIDFQSIRHAHTVFQENIAKRIELRVTVVGDRVFPAEIHSQQTSRQQTDWRHYASYAGETLYSVHDMPEAVAEQCRQVVARLGLGFAALDLILTPEGEYVFLESNTNGQYGWIEEATGMPISDAIADLLILGSQTARMAA